MRPWGAGVPVGPAQHSWCGPGVREFLWGLHNTASVALACGGSCGACTAQLVRPWRAGVPVGPSQHSWCGLGVRGFLWGLHSTGGAALACGGSCGACTALLLRPWRAGVPVGPVQQSWCGPGVRGFLWGLYSRAGAALACGGSCGARRAPLVRPRCAGPGRERHGAPRSTVPCAVVLFTHERAPAGGGAKGGGGGGRGNHQSPRGVGFPILNDQRLRTCSCRGRGRQDVEPSPWVGGPDIARVATGRCPVGCASLVR